VGAVRLLDGREVVVKVRPDNPRLRTCREVHSLAWEAGFPCPEPLVGPLALGPAVASAERYLPGGVPGRWDDADLARRTANQLQRLVALAPPPSSLGTLSPPPPWVGWSDPRAPWPLPDEGPELSHHPATTPLRDLAGALND
jgi:hypothetical protein